MLLQVCPSIESVECSDVKIIGSLEASYVEVEKCLWWWYHESLIQRFMLAGSYIVSDDWAAYSRIEEIGHVIYSNAVIVRERTFLDPDKADSHTIKWGTGERI